MCYWNINVQKAYIPISSGEYYEITFLRSGGFMHLFHEAS